MHEVTNAIEDAIREVRVHGFAVVPSIVSPHHAEVMKADLQEAIDEDLKAWEGREYQGAHMVMNLMFRGAPFLQFLDNDRLHDVLTPLVSDTCIVYAYTSSSMPPSGTNYSNRIHVDCPRHIPGYISNVGVCLALDDFTDDNGATYFLPKSFELGSAPSREEFFAGAKRVYPRAGDAIVFNARTFHSGGFNSTSTYRHAVTINVCRSYMRQQFDFPRMFPPAAASSLSDRQRRFLGYNVRVPISLEEYYLPEADRPYKSNQG